jgi:hypothetical protein
MPNEKANIATDNMGGNQGEGNREAAKAYDKATAHFIKSGRVEKAAREAAEDIEGPKKAELEEAEKAGRSHAKS